MSPVIPVCLSGPDPHPGNRSWLCVQRVWKLLYVLHEDQEGEWHETTKEGGGVRSEQEVWQRVGV